MKLPPRIAAVRRPNDFRSGLIHQPVQVAPSLGQTCVGVNQFWCGCATMPPMYVCCTKSQGCDVSNGVCTCMSYGK
jgi:hypothetical protein